MINAIFTGITAYISTGVDYLLILMTVLTFYSEPSERIKVYLGDLIGTIFLISISLLFSLSSRFLPAEWMLGLLGIIPILIGLYILIHLDGDNEQEQVTKRLSKNNLILSVIIITITTCGADNIGIYVPIFAQISHWGELIIILMTFFVMLTIFFLLGLVFVRLPVVARILAKYGDLFTAVVYIGIGGFILIEANTINHFIGLII